MKQTLSITRKELSAYFGSPMALIFIGVTLLAALIAFFWIDTFFARGIADVRPLFRWMPVLMIFLLASLTMRQWSEEQRSGTLEVLLTLPVSKVQLVLGKFLAVMALVAITLALTLPLPLTAAALGNLDWGPVIGGYLAALLMAAAYAAIGLYVSSRTDNQIVSLILTAVLCGFFYAIGSPVVTDLVGRDLADILRALGIGSRFESIQRGVIDLRDLVYYLSLTGIFLALNVLSIDSKRWAKGGAATASRRAIVLTSGLLVANLLLVNLWVYPLSGLRADLTAGREFSLSSATKTLLGGLQEPLTIRAYVSEKTHPLLAPLTPQLADMLREYQIAGRGKVEVEVVDPTKDPDKEQEANQTYNIQPTPFQVSGRYEAGVINSYFDVLVRYGDQNTVLGFRDLIDVQQQRDGNPLVRFRNLEYDLTRAVKKTVYGFQSIDNVLASMSEPVKLMLVVTPDTLPADLKGGPDIVQKVAQELQAKSKGKFSFEQVNPDAPNAAITRAQLQSTYKLRPISASLFSSASYYLDMLLQIGKQTQVLAVSDELNEASVRTAIEAALKRSSPGFLKVVGWWAPQLQPTQNLLGQAQQPLESWQTARQQVAQDYTVRNVDLSSGQAPSDIDVLVLIAPQGLDERAQYAVDQYLMRGGALVVMASNYSLVPDQFTGDLALQPLEGTLTPLLESYGLRLEPTLVMDTQNEPFPIQVARKVGNSTVREFQAVNYPFFVDVRPAAMDAGHPIVSKLTAVTLNWPSPITVIAEKNQGRQVSTLLKSTANSWLRATPNIAVDTTKPNLGFNSEGERGSRPLAVAVRGSFESAFKGKEPPAAPTPAPTSGQQAPAPTPAAPKGSLIESSPETARLVVVGSSDFLADLVFQISSSLSGNRYLNSLQLLQNAVDWSVEDTDLLTIRARGGATRVLRPMAEGDQKVVEVLNYGVALLALVGLGLLWLTVRRREQPMALEERRDR